MKPELTSARRKKADRYMKVFGSLLYALHAAQIYILRVKKFLSDFCKTNLFPTNGGIVLSFRYGGSWTWLLEDN
jgi:hypothetical protein